jgi:hypothetical protein
VFLRRVLQLLVTPKVVPRYLILFTVMMEDIYSSETCVITRVMRCDIQEDVIYLFIRTFSFDKTYIAEKWKRKEAIYLFDE